MYVLLYILYIKKNKSNLEFYFGNYSNEQKYSIKKFAIIQRKCELCGLFSFYIVNLGCIHKFLLEGFIPIIDIKSFPNALNGFNITKQNYWELFFKQPFGYTLEFVLKNEKNIIYVQCQDCNPRPDFFSMLFNEPKRRFWHDFSNNYMPIKNYLINLSNKIIQRLFNKSKNILGVLTRGTDYISKKPKGHPIQPNIIDVINDVKKLDKQYNYDYIFFSTEDDLIRDKFTIIFKSKVKQIKQKFNINYDYNKKNYLNNNENIKGNTEYSKIYLLNIIILSKCLDIIASRCSGTAGIFVLTNGFRNMKIYDLGVY